jgi:hypothetical protein
VTGIDDVVEQLELAVGLAEEHMEDDAFAAVVDATLRVRSRVGHLGSTLVLALLGGSGAGKSSLLNAIAGERVASTGALRPHTQVPLAWIPETAEPSLTSLLDDLSITERITHDGFPGLAILDMTDVDSVEAGHRRTVEAVMPAVDVALWVLDPDRYADAALHRDFLGPSASGADRLVFALNRIDTIAGVDRPALREHLVALLRADGIDEPVVFEVAADPAAGPPVGIDDLVAHLRDRLDDKRVHLGRVVDDAVEVARSVAASLGLESGGSTGFDAAWGDMCSWNAEAVARGLSVTSAEEVMRSVEHLVAGVSARLGGSVAAGMRAAFTPDVVERQVIEALRVAGVDDVPAKRGDGGVFVSELDRRIGEPLRSILWRRATLAAVVAGLTVDAAAAAHRLRGA